MGSKIVVVTGDVTMDWNLARTQSLQSSGTSWNADDTTRSFLQPGGSALVANVISAIAKEAGNCEIRKMSLPRLKVHPSDDRFHHSYALWSPFKYSTKSSEAEKPVWRVAEFLGLDRGDSGVADWKKVENDFGKADVIIFDDAGLGFREHAELWPLDAIGSDTWIIHKMAKPVAQGLLWARLLEQWTERMVVIMTVNDLRRTEVQISRELSWERTAQDLAWELVHNPRLNTLSQCAHVVITFDTAGALLMSRCNSGTDSVCSLFFDPAVIEGMWAQNYPGGMIGYTTCLTAGIAHQLILASSDLDKGIQNGLAAMRKLHLDGYGVRTESIDDCQLAFPTDRVISEIFRKREKGMFAVARVQDPVRFLKQRVLGHERAPEGGFWTILQDRFPDTLEQVARDIVLDGPEVAIQSVPLGQFGKLLTVDRQEIESFRSIRTLVAEYCRKKQPEQPLSIAVFGAPGSGKSFGILEMAKSLLPGQIEKRTFNLSQFSDPEQLYDAMHQVRDVGLSGLIPLVFWDEFDTTFNDQKLGWLRYFLAPMQDGKFQKGQITHSIGRAIFVFAGGTCWTMEEFDKGSRDKDFVEAKGPDFVSRLKGHVNILGPNPRRNDRFADPYYVIRRAILVRSLLQRNASQLFPKKDGKGRLNIDQGVLRAFLLTKQYKHGARSMESIIAMSTLMGKNQFERSSLPSQVQLDLHVYGIDFLSLVQQIELQGALLDKLAEVNHNIYCEGLRSRGYTFGSQSNDELKISSSLRPYAELPDHEKEQNKNAVRHIPDKLARIGYVMVPARSDEPPFNFPGPDLDDLAEMEHQRWMALKIKQGWRYAPQTEKEKKLHEALLPWRKLSAEERAALAPTEQAALGEGPLPESEKEKDRDQVRGIPRMLSEVGFTVRKT